MALTITPSLTPATGTASAPKTISFAGTASGGATPYTYSWSFGDGNVASTATGTHQYLAAGTYTVTLHVVDGLGAVADWSTSYVVNPRLNVSFTHVVTVGVGGSNSVEFTDATTGGTNPKVYAWDFGDGNTSGDVSPTHVYDEAGSYTVRLTVTDADAHVGRSTVNVAITNPMTLTISASPIRGSDPLLVNLTAVADGGTEPYQYTWDFGDGTVGTGSPVQHTFTSPYTPWAAGSVNAGDLVKANGGAWKAMSTGTSTAAPYGTTDVTVGGISWKYLKPITSAIGTYEVKVGVVDALLHDTGGSVVIEVLDTLRSDPDRFPEKGTPPFPVTFYANVVGGLKPYTYRWDFADGTDISTVQNPVHVFTKPGYYNVELTVTDEQGRTHTTYVAVDAGELPPPPPPSAGVTIYGYEVTIYGNNFTIYGQGD